MRLLGLSILLMLSFIRSGIADAASVSAGERKEAIAVLRHFLSLLAEKKYDQASLLYAGDYDTLHEWNEKVPPSDHAQLWRNGCEMNGLQCHRLHRVLSVKRGTASTLQLQVQFSEDGKKPFRICTDAPPVVYSFSFRLRKEGNSFVVLDMPSYCP